MSVRRIVGEDEGKQESGIPIGMTYALGFAIYGILFPFFPIVLKSQGLDDSQTSLALSGAGLAALVGPIIFAHVADRKVAFRRLLPLLLAVSTIVLELMRFSRTVSSAFCAVFLLYFFLIPGLSLLDSFCMDFVLRGSDRGRPRRFQDYRIWGSIGFMFPAVALALWFSEHTAQSSLLITMTMCFTSATAVCALLLPPNAPSRKVAKLPSVEAFRAAMRSPLREFFLANFFAGVGLSIYYISYPIFLHQLGCSVVELGLIINLGVLYEILVMPFAERLIRFVGIRWIILIGFATIPVRMALSAWWPTIPMAIGVQLLHAPLVLGLFVAVPIFLQEQALPSFRHSLQSLNATMIFGLTRFIGPAVGSLVVVSAPGGGLDGLIRGLVLAGLCGAVATAIFYFACNPKAVSAE
jgi:PPP family 3-phenylpropionic acid transporter